MTCQEVVELMQRDLDQDLNEEENNILQTHLEGCSECPAIFERMKLLSNELTMLPKVNPPYSLVDQIMPQLERIDRSDDLGDQRQSPATMGWGKWIAQSMHMRTFGGIAAAVLVMFIVFSNNLPFGLKQTSFETAMNADIADTANNQSPGAHTMNNSRMIQESADGSPENVEVKMFKGESVTPTSMQDQSGSQKPELTSNHDNYVVQDRHFTSNSSSESDFGSEQNDIRALEMPFTALSLGQSYVSPNEKYTAFVNQDGALFRIVITNRDGEQIYSSREFEADLLINVQWAEDSKNLQYETLIGEAVSLSKISID